MISRLITTRIEYFFFIFDAHVKTNKHVFIVLVSRKTFWFIFFLKCKLWFLVTVQPFKMAVEDSKYRVECTRCKTLPIVIKGRPLQISPLWVNFNLFELMYFVNFILFIFCYYLYSIHNIIYRLFKFWTKLFVVIIFIILDTIMIYLSIFF